MNTVTTAPTRQRLFIGIPIPERAHEALKRTLKSFEGHIKQAVPKEQWHLTCLWIGECEVPEHFLETFGTPMPQQFLPTISLTHAGRGLQPHQLWVYALATPLLTHLRQQLQERLALSHFATPLARDTKPFVPHIHLADLAPTSGHVLADQLVGVTFPVPMLHVYHSETVLGHRRYTPLTSISLTS